MCGISGIYSFTEQGKRYIDKLPDSAKVLSKRGPDAEGFFYHDNIALAHRRLSIIDTSVSANQPMFDSSGRYVIVFNGEIFNYKELYNQHLQPTGYIPTTSSDTEILLQLFIQFGVKCFNWLSGFFALAIYDKVDETILLARDRFGKKPLLYFMDEDKLVFASEMKSLLQFQIPNLIDYTSLFQYFQLNYIPSPDTIFTGVKKMPPGNYAIVKNKSVQLHTFYQIENKPSNNISYVDAKKQLVSLMDEAVKRRLISDVPLGAFLSGGIDSSVVVSLASRHTPHLNTFSIGYKDEPFFDETKYANLVAEKCNTNHTVFSLGNDEFLEHLFDVLDYIDEPFADSSCLPTYILCKRTRQMATVALSGDGGDEVFAGYNKHAAEYKIRQKSLLNGLVKNFGWLWKNLPKSRNGKITNIFRQLHRYSVGANMQVKDRYYAWCSITSPEDVKQMFQPIVQNKIDDELFLKRTNFFTQHINNEEDFNQILLADMNGLLVSDMLHKVDMMSMANSLEVRSPFLDVDVVDFAFSLDETYKINHHQKKRIVQDAFKEMLPPELYNRPKKGFEVPLLNWFKNELHALIDDDLLSDEFVREQGIFNPIEIQRLKKQLFSIDPGDIHAIIWQLIVFQYWWKKNMI